MRNRITDLFIMARSSYIQAMTKSFRDAAPGEYWVYRLREESPSERVLIKDLKVTKTKFRAIVTFDEGRKENIPGSRLKVLWDEVQQYDELMDKWAKLAEHTLDEIESCCVDQVFDMMVPLEVADLIYRPVDNILYVHDSETFSEMLGVDIGDYARNCRSFELDDTLVLSPHAAVVIAERLCRVNPTPVLEKVMEEETEARHKSKHGYQGSPISEDDTGWRSSEWAYQMYREYTRPRHELLRQWCGHRAISNHERLNAFEAECHRLGVLLEDALEELMQLGGQHAVETFRQQLEEERITPYNIRAVPERPLDPSEIPIQTVYKPRRRWW